MALKSHTRETLWFWTFISPWFVGFLFLTVGPIGLSIVMSFSEWDIFNAPRFIGLGNYFELVRNDPIFVKAIRNTVFYAIVSNIFGMSGALVISRLLHQPIGGIGAYRTMIYLPSVVPAVAIAMLFRRVFAPNGILNWFLSIFGISGPAWLLEPGAVLWALAIMSLWGIGTATILLLAGMEGIPRDLYEAAAIDGSNSVKSYVRITLPMLSPVIFFNLVMGVIAGLQVFGPVYVMTQGKGSPDNGSMMMVLYLFNNAFRYFKMGYASAIAWVLFVMIMILTLLVFRSSSLWVYYESERKK